MQERKHSPQAWSPGGGGGPLRPYLFERQTSNPKKLSQDFVEEEASCSPSREGRYHEAWLGGTFTVGQSLEGQVK